ncbi:MAG: CoA-binding protein [Candidatus Woesearchaeota archaeon]
MHRFLNKKNIIAVVGASRNLAKYGHTVFVHFLHAGYDVIPINPFERDISGVDCYDSIEDVPKKIDVVLFIVSPDKTNKILEKVKELNITKVWFQPGSSDEKSIQFCKDNNIEYMDGVCVLVSQYKNE